MVWIEILDGLKKKLEAAEKWSTNSQLRVAECYVDVSRLNRVMAWMS